MCMYMVCMVCMWFVCVCSVYDVWAVCMVYVYAICIEYEWSMYMYGICICVICVSGCQPLLGLFNLRSTYLVGKSASKD